VDRRFTALRIIGTVFKVLAWIGLILGLLGAIGTLILGFTLSGQQGFLGLDLGSPILASIAMFVFALIVAVINFLILYAVGESVYVFLSIEENTRRTAYILQQQYMSYQGSYPSAAASPRDFGE